MRRQGPRFRETQACLLLAVLALLDPRSAQGACGDTARQSPEFRAAEACERVRAAELHRDATATVAAVTDLNATGYCRMPAMPGFSFEPQNQALCADPNGFVCGPGGVTGGRVMNSKCEFLHLDSEPAGRTPSWVSAYCGARDQMLADYEQYRRSSACAGASDRACRQLYASTHANQNLLRERRQVYTRERLEKVTEIFERVRSKYEQLITESSRIPEDRKAMLIERIRATTLLTSTDQERQLMNPNNPHGECLNSSRGVPRTGAYNSIERTVGGRLSNTIVICAGFMANLEHMNPYLLMEILGHEISHSIDPCTLELAAYDEGRGRARPNQGLEVYPGLMPCLRGGSGESGCEGNPVLHCTSDAGISEKCGRDRSCRAEARMTPSCRHGGPGHMHQVGSVRGSGDYRDRGAALDQSGEAFGDFMGAEIVGRLMKEDSQTPPYQPGLRGRRDALISISSAFSRLHGVCLNQNTPDEHPPGYLRVNRLIMGSAAFREAVGCRRSGPPQTEGAGISCTGF